MADRYEINHSGEIVVGESALCADQTKMLQDLFSQYGWSCTEEGKERQSMPVRQQSRIKSIPQSIKESV